MKRILSDSFLFKIFRHSKGLLAVLMIYIFFVGRSVFQKKETIPFYIYSMYSGHYGEWNEFEVPVILINGTLLDLQKLPYHQFEFLMNILHQYKSHFRKGFQDLPADSQEAFRKWLIAYLSRFASQNISALELRLDVVTYIDSRYELKKSHRLLNYAITE